MESSSGRAQDPQAETAAAEGAGGGWARAVSAVRESAWTPVAIVAFSMIAVATAMATQFSYTDGVPRSTGHWQGFALGAVLFGVSALVVTGSTPAYRAAAAPLVSRRIEIAAIASALLIGAFFRLYHFHSFPPGVWFDEGIYGTDALDIIHKDHFTVWRETNFGKPTPYIYLLAASTELFGRTYFALRILPVIAGISAIIAFYFLCRHLLGPIPAMLTTAMLATSRWAVTFSRISWEASLMPLMTSLSIFFLFKSLDSRNRAWFFLAGGTLAAGLYTHQSFRILPVVVLALLIYAAITEWNTIRRSVPGLLIYSAAFAIVLAPLAHFTILHSDQVLSRTRDVNVFKEVAERNTNERLMYNVRASVKMMNVTGDGNGRHNIPGAPMLDEVTGTLFVLGLAAGIAGFRSWRRGGIVVWYVLALVPGVLTITRENPSSIRGLGAIPPLYLMVALTFVVLQRSLSPFRYGSQAFAVVACALVAFSAAINYQDLFTTQLHDRVVYDAFFPANRYAGEFIAAHGDDAHVHISTAYAGDPAAVYLSDDKPYARYNAAASLVFAESDQPHIVIADRSQFAIIPTLQRLYPNLMIEERRDPFERLPFVVITIPMDDVAALHRVPLTTTDGAGKQVSTRERVDRTWTDADLADGPIAAVWDGYIWSEGDGVERALTVEGLGPTTLIIDGQRQGDSAETVTSAPFRWPVGEHRVTIQAQVERPGALKLAYVRGDQDRPAPDVLYGASVGDRGFRAVYRQGTDVAAEPVDQWPVPSIVPVPAFGEAKSIEYLGLFDVDTPGRYGFALDGLTSQLVIDGQTVVDNGGTHSPLRVEGFTDLDAGEHLVSLQFTVDDEPSFFVDIKRPGEDWQRLDSSEFAVPPADYRPPGSIGIQPEESWGPGGKRTVSALSGARAVDIVGDTMYISNARDIAVTDLDGRVLKTFLNVGEDIADVAGLSDGGIAFSERAGNALVILGADGQVRQRYAGLRSAAGVGAFGGYAYMASPSGGVVYRASITGGEIEELPIEDLHQPADVVALADDDLYISDFEVHEVARSDGNRITDTFPAAPGSGVNLPRIALANGLLLVMDPVRGRVLVVDAETGKNRGTYVLPPRPEKRITGIATRDNAVYLVDTNAGDLYRLLLDTGTD